MKTTLIASMLALAVTANAAAAGELILGAGAVDMQDRRDKRAGSFTLGAYTDPLTWWGPVGVGLGGAGVVDAYGDSWIGAGVVATVPMGDTFFFQGSFMPGHYNGVDGGIGMGDDLEFRTEIGIGARLANGSAISLNVNHRSNAGLGWKNPGVEELSLQYHIPFGGPRAY